jgi:PhnB protein
MASHTTTATPYLTARDAVAALEFYKRAFGADEVLRILDDDGRVSHAEISIGGARIFVSDEYPDIGVVSPQALGGTASAVVLEVADADATFAQAVAAGATVMRPVADQFGGAARAGRLKDPFGHDWLIRSENAEAMRAQLAQFAAKGEQ